MWQVTVYFLTARKAKFTVNSAEESKQTLEWAANWDFSPIRKLVWRKKENYSA